MDFKENKQLKDMQKKTCSSSNIVNGQFIDITF